MKQNPKINFEIFSSFSNEITEYSYLSSLNKLGINLISPKMKKK